MSREDVEVVGRSFDAWNSGDVEAIRRCYTDEPDIRTGMTEFGRSFEGDDPIRHWVAEMRETWSEVHWDPERIFEAGDLVVSFYRAVGIGRESGVDSRATSPASAASARGASEHVFLDRADALEAAGLGSS
jgi:ketosteroid isomerase-like protein